MLQLRADLSRVRVGHYRILWAQQFRGLRWANSISTILRSRRSAARKQSFLSRAHADPLEVSHELASGRPGSRDPPPPGLLLLRTARCPSEPVGCPHLAVKRTSNPNPRNAKWALASSTDLYSDSVLTLIAPMASRLRCRRV